MRRFQARCGSSGGENCSASRTASALRPQFACAPLRAACALIPVFLESAASVRTCRRAARGGFSHQMGSSLSELNVCSAASSESYPCRSGDRLTRTAPVLVGQYTLGRNCCRPSEPLSSRVSTSTAFAFQAVCGLWHETHRLRWLELVGAARSCVSASQRCARAPAELAPEAGYSAGCLMMYKGNASRASLLRTCAAASLLRARPGKISSRRKPTAKREPPPAGPSTQSS